METLQTLLSINFNYILIGLMVIFYSLEQILNTQFKFNKRPQHLMHNLLFFATFYLCNIVWAIVTVYSIDWLNNNQVGLFYLVQLPLWLKLVLAVAIFDMVTYWFHRIAHKVPVLWRFHRVHHSDTSMDASTYLRAHPLELTLWFGTSNILAAGIFGLDLLSLGLYFLVATPFVFLQHSNLRFPRWLDNTFGWVFTTPNLHKIHHDQDQPFTDSNFSDIFILWDRLFGTFKHKPVAEIRLGLKEFEENRKQSFWYLFISPFVKIERIQTNDLKK